MNFSELIFLLSTELNNVKKDDLDKNISDRNPILKFIIIAYNNVLKKLRENASKTETVTEDKINNMELTKTMKSKLIALSKTKITKKLKADQKLLNFKQELDDLLGIGEKKISDLIKMGLTSIRQLKEKKYFNTLNIDTQMTIIHNPVRVIKWEDIHKIEPKLTKFNKFIKIVGSYRRKKPFLRDIDILFLQDKNNTIENYLNYLKKEFNNNVYIYANGLHKISMIFQPGNDPNIKYKSDIFITTKDKYYTTLLYATGSKYNNIKMRAKAKRLNYLLNQDGIFDKNKKKINLDTDDEKKLFKILDMPYLEPEQRF